MKISLIIPIHNGLAETKKCLRSLSRSIRYSKQEKSVNIIFVDDGSSDHSSLWIAEHYPHINILTGDGNLWWSGAINKGIRKALEDGSSHILIFNNDNMVATNYFSALFESQEEFSRHVIIASTVYDIYPNKTLRYGGQKFDRKQCRYIKYGGEGVRKVNSSGGMGVLIPASVFPKVGVFDEISFPQKYGDSDFFLRAEHIPMIVNPKCVVYNDNRTSGFKNNTSIAGIRDSLSYPKGYANILIEYRFYIKHSDNKFLGQYRVLISSLAFILRGLVKILIGMK